MGLAASAAFFFPTNGLDWQPTLWPSQPWRCWSAAWVHWSAQHLGMNYLGLGAVAVLGWRAGLGTRASGAWALSWPLTQLGLLVQPGLLHYGGLSGWVHAGVAVAACHLLLEAGRRQRERVVGAAIALGLVLKIGLEQPLASPPLRHVAGLDFALAPLAHLSGALAGGLAVLLVLLVALVARAFRAWRRRPR